MSDRWQISAWNDQEEAVEISVPEGDDGRYIRRILGNARDAGTPVEYGERVMLHSDGRNYRTAYVKGYNAQEIADKCIAELALLPILTSNEEAEAIIRGRNNGS